MYVQFDVDLERLVKGQTADLAGESGSQFAARDHEIERAAAGSDIVFLELRRTFG